GGALGRCARGGRARDAGGASGRGRRRAARRHHRGRAQAPAFLIWRPRGATLDSRRHFRRRAGVGGKHDHEGCCGKGEGPSFAGRWLKRLLVLAVLGFGGLGYGFYQKVGPDGVAQKKLPWQDPQGFQEYTVATLTWAKDEGTKYAVQAKEKIEKIEW